MILRVAFGTGSGDSKGTPLAWITPSPLDRLRSSVDIQIVSNLSISCAFLNCLWGLFREWDAIFGLDETGQWSCCQSLHARTPPPNRQATIFVAPPSCTLPLGQVPATRGTSDLEEAIAFERAVSELHQLSIPFHGDTERRKR